jgi:hypothetical protein
VNGEKQEDRLPAEATALYGDDKMSAES